MAEAQKRIDAGLGRSGRDTNVHVRIAQAQLERQQEDKRRLNDPVEQAKTILRRRYPNVISAETREGSSGKGFYFVGNLRVDEAEFLAMAARLAA
jgi:hypothetical protein